MKDFRCTNLVRGCPHELPMPSRNDVIGECVDYLKQEVNYFNHTNSGKHKGLVHAVEALEAMKEKTE